MDNLNDQNAQLERDQLIFNLISERYASEENRLNIIDDKASKMIIFVGILISLQSAFGSLLLKDIPKTVELYNYYLASFILSITFLIAAIVCSLCAYKIRSWKIVPKTSTMIEYGKENKSKEDILRIISKERSDAELNNDKIRDKVKFIKCGFIFLILGVISTLFFISLLLYTI